MKTDRHRDMQTDRHRDMQADRHRYMQTDRESIGSITVQSDKNTDTQTQRYAEQTDTEIIHNSNWLQTDTQTIR